MVVGSIDRAIEGTPQPAWVRTLAVGLATTDGSLR